METRQDWTEATPLEPAASARAGSDDPRDEMPPATANPPPPPPDLSRTPAADLARSAATSTNPWLQAEVLEELAQRRADETLATALTLLRAGRPDVRLVAADAVKDLGQEEAVPPLRAALQQEPDPTVRLAIQEALAGLEDPAR